MKKYILFFAMACLVAACSNDIATSELTTQKATLNLLLSAAPNVASRAINAQADGKIYDCTVITFDKNGNVSGKGYQTVEGGVDKFNMAVGLSTNKGEKCKVYAVANTNNPTLFDNVTSLTSFLDMFVTIASPEALTAGNINVCAGASSTALTTQGQLMVSDSLPVTITDGVYTLKPDATELDDIDDLDATYEKVASTSSEYDNAVDDAHRLNADDVTDMEAQAKVLTNTEHPYYFKVGEDYYRVTLSKPFYTDIYVTYDKNDLVKFNDDASPYLLKFLDPFNDGYFLEDGNDKLTTERIQAVYPYTNGDGSLNIYGEAMNEEQMGGGAATRPRWVWFFDSDHDDPYHVKIHSKSTISYNSVSHPTYLQTYAVHFKQDANVRQQRVITVGMLPGIASVLPTEYMILGVEGRYKLLTANPVEADLNGDGDTEDANENDRQYITSLEQYWKTYNMAKLHVLGISKSTNAFSNDESTWVVPTADDPSTGGVDESTYRATLVARDWHSYDVIANATRWNGYNDKEDGFVSPDWLLERNIRFVSYPWKYENMFKGEIEKYSSAGITVFSRTKFNTKNGKLKAAGVSVNLIAKRFDGILIIFQYPLYMLTYFKRIYVKKLVQKKTRGN